MMQADFRTLFDHAPRRTLAKGQTLFRLGTPVERLYLVETGHISLERPLPSGQTVPFQQAGPGDILAEASVYASTYHCDAIIRAPTRIAACPVSEFRAALHRDPSRAEAWAAHLARTVHNTRWRAEIRSLKTVAERLDAWLDRGHPLPPKGQIQNLAEELAVSREALYRELARRRTRHV